MQVSASVGDTSVLSALARAEPLRFPHTRFLNAARLDRTVFSPTPLVGGGEHLADRPTQPVHLLDYEMALGAQVSEGRLQGRTLGPCPPSLLCLEHGGTTGARERVALQMEVLLVGAHAGVGDELARIEGQDRLCRTIHFLA
jgi:hypothetical protein